MMKLLLSGLLRAYITCHVFLINITCRIQGACIVSISIAPAALHPTSSSQTTKIALISILFPVRSRSISQKCSSQFLILAKQQHINKKHLRFFYNWIKEVGHLHLKSSLHYHISSHSMCLYFGCWFLLISGKTKIPLKCANW